MSQPKEQPLYQKDDKDFKNQSFERKGTAFEAFKLRLENSVQHPRGASYFLRDYDKLVSKYFKVESTKTKNNDTRYVFKPTTYLTGLYVNPENLFLSNACGILTHVKGSITSTFGHHLDSGGKRVL